MGQEGDGCRLRTPVTSVIDVDGSTPHKDRTLAITLKDQEAAAQGNTKRWVQVDQG